MEQLARIIGPAPSELSLEELLTKLRNEHHRVLEGLTSWRADQTKRGRKVLTKEVSPLKKIKSLEEELGMTVEQLLELVKNGGA